MKNFTKIDLNSISRTSRNNSPRTLRNNSPVYLLVWWLGGATLESFLIRPYAGCTAAFRYDSHAVDQGLRVGFLGENFRELLWRNDELYPPNAIFVLRQHFHARLLVLWNDGNGVCRDLRRSWSEPPQDDRRHEDAGRDERWSMRPPSWSMWPLVRSSSPPPCLWWSRGSR